MKKTGIIAAFLLAVSACATQQPSSGYKLSGDFRVIEIAGEMPVSDRETVSFDAANNRVAAYFGCNRMMGSYRQRDNALTFGLMVSTLMACLGSDDDGKGAKALKSVRSWRSDKIGGNGYLYLLDREGTAVMQLRVLPASNDS